MANTPLSVATLEWVFVKNRSNVTVFFSAVRYSVVIEAEFFTRLDSG